MQPCDKADDIKEIKDKIDDMRELLHTYLIKQTEIKKDVALHKRMWSGLIGLIITVALYFTQRFIN